MFKQFSWGLLMLAGVLAVAAGGASAQVTKCTGTLPPGDYNQLIVPAGAKCTISRGDVTVENNVTVGRRASLRVLAPAKFTDFGSLTAAGADAIDIVPEPKGAASIFGDISATGITVSVRIEETSVDGNVSVANSRGEFVELSRDNVAGNVVVRNNKTGQNLITGNAIGGNLVCSDNTPAPVDQGKPNTVGGNKVGQCTRL